MQRMENYVTYFLHHGVELFLVVVVAFGGYWAKAFLGHDEWSPKMESFVDYLMICQSWFIFPAALATCILVCPQSELPWVKGAAFVVFAIAVIAILMLISLSRHGLKRRNPALRFLFKWVPIVMICFKFYLEEQGGQGHHSNKDVSIPAPVESR
jgi:hypothetical protein